MCAQTPQHNLSIVVDGSKTPELIPDDLAYRHFILAIAEPRSPTVEETKRRETRLIPIGLSASDYDLCISALAGLREKLDMIEAGRREALADTTEHRDSTLLTLKGQENMAITAVRVALRRLSPDGQSRLDGYIRARVKQRIVLLGDARE